MENSYYFLLKRVREIRRQYKNLDIEEKIKLLNLEIKLEGKRLKAEDCHTKSEKKALKKSISARRKEKEKRF